MAAKDDTAQSALSTPLPSQKRAHAAGPVCPRCDVPAYWIHTHYYCFKCNTVIVTCCE